MMVVATGRREEVEAAGRVDEGLAREACRGTSYYVIKET